MAVYPVEVFTKTSALVGYNDDYKSSAIAQKFTGFPKGAYVGFTPSVTPPSPILTLAVDPSEGFSLIKLPSRLDPGGLDIIVDQDITLDFTGQPVGDFPLQVVVRAVYSADGSTPTGAEIITRSIAPRAFYEVLLCVVSGTPTSLVVAADPSTGQRDEPIAYNSVEFGFMPAGSVEDLSDAVQIVNEITAARVGLDATVYDTISDRLAADQSAVSMASRLGLVLSALRSNDYFLGAAVSSINVSGSFSEVSRDYAPEVTLGGQGSETEEGALASPNDPIRNIAIIQDAVTGYRTLDDTTNRRVVFGRITGPTELIVTGTYAFENAQKGVSITDGSPTTDLEVGDTILGPDGLYYAVGTIFSDTDVELVDEYRGASASSDNLIGRRWSLGLYKIQGSSEVSASLSVAATIRFYFPSFLTLGQSIADQRLIHQFAGGREPLSEATTTLKGRLLLGEADGRLGGVIIQSAGAPLTGGPFHTINFPDGGGQTIQTGSGEVTIGRIGQKGPQGPDGQAGGTGPTGPTGPGLTQIQVWSPSTWLPASGYNVGTNPYSYSVGLGMTIRVLSGGIATWDSNIFEPFTPDAFEITAITGVGTSTGQIDVTLSNDVRVKLFLSAAGD